MKSNSYRNFNEFVNDLRLMFKNPRTYNEDGSLVVQDVIELEKILEGFIDGYSQDAELSQ